ncbi:MAG TPA: aminotransferase class III-fold pyridoxal phosphate-dependent enzyme [Acidimicrobiales bacterium]|nr:aminotransferase class III-fold pyridoxal phosphate-dependent enzyme [Acidimicrobiales bacterium]
MAPSPTSSLWPCQAHPPTAAADRVVLVRGQASTVYDNRGRAYLDAPASLWFCNVGHGRRELAEAAAAQMTTLETFNNFGRYATAPTLELADRLAPLLPMPEAKVFFTSGGGDGIDTAAKLAQWYWAAVGRPAKRTIVTRELAYHGLHGWGTSITGIEANTEAVGRPISSTIRVPTHDLDFLEALLAERSDEIAAFFTEPVIGTGGVVPPQPGYLAAARELCRRHDVLWVSDEVVTGFGRTGTMFASAGYGIEPDMMVVAKGITSGYVPLGAVAVGPRVAEPFWSSDPSVVFRHGLTYSGHATACAVALAHLDLLEREDLVARVAALEPVLDDALEPLRRHPLVREVRGPVGLMAGVELTDPAVGAWIERQALEAGVLTRVLGGRTLQVSPPFVIEEEQLRRIAGTWLELLDRAPG